MSDLRAISAYAAAKPVTPVFAAHAEKPAVKTETQTTANKTTTANHGPAVKVTLSAEATKALETARTSTPKPSTVLVKHDSAPATTPAVPTAAKTSEKHAAPVTTARK